MLVLLALSPSAQGADNAAVRAAIQAHQDGDFASARVMLEKVLGDPQLPPSDRIKAREYLASSKLALGDRPGAKAVLLRLLSDSPGTVIDPDLFDPDLIILEQEARLELARTSPPPPPITEKSRPASSPSLGVPAAIGAGACVIGGAVLFGLGKQDAATLEARPLPPSVNIQSTASQGRTFEPLGVALLAVGGVGLAGSVLWWALGASEGTPRVAVMPAPGGAAIGFAGALP